MRRKSRPFGYKSGFTEDQPLVIGKRYHFVWTRMPGAEEIHFRGLLDDMDETTYYVVEGFASQQIPIDRVLDVLEVIGGE